MSRALNVLKGPASATIDGSWFPSVMDERVGHPEGVRLEGAGVTEEGAEYHHAPQNLHGELAIPHDAVNIKHMQRSRSHSMALVRTRASW